MNETKAEKLARKCTPQLSFSDLPIVLHDNEVASIVLYAMKRIMRIRNTAIIIKWNDAGFNDVATMPGCRNGVPGQTKAAIISHIKESGGIDAMNLNTVFIFSNGRPLMECMQGLLLPWVRKQTGVPDVCHSICRITKVSLSIIDPEIFDYPFKV